MSQSKEYRNRKRSESDEVTYKMQAHIGTIGTSRNGWTREVNIISWNGQEPGLDIRSWNPEHSKMSRGVNLNQEECSQLQALLQEFSWDEVLHIDWEMAQV